MEFKPGKMYVRDFESCGGPVVDSLVDSFDGVVGTVTNTTWHLRTKQELLKLSPDTKEGWALVNSVGMRGRAFAVLSDKYKAHVRDHIGFCSSTAVLCVKEMIPKNWRILVCVPIPDPVWQELLQLEALPPKRFYLVLA